MAPQPTWRPRWRTPSRREGRGGRGGVAGGTTAVPLLGARWQHCRPPSHGTWRAQIATDPTACWGCGDARASAWDGQNTQKNNVLSFVSVFTLLIQPRKRKCNQFSAALFVRSQTFCPMYSRTTKCTWSRNDGSVWAQTACSASPSATLHLSLVCAAEWRPMGKR